MFLLEQLGWQYGMHVYFHAQHESRDGQWVHRVLRSSDSRLADRLAAAGEDWAIQLADELIASPAEVTASDGTPTGAAMASELNEPNRLYSWVIAPRRG